VLNEDERKHYVDIVGRIINGKPYTFDEFQQHIEIQNRNVRSGPPVGEIFPDYFKLPNQIGVVKTIQSLAGPSGLLLVFVRSVVRCPYCRNQLAEMSQSLDDLLERGFNVAAVTTDSEEVVREFVDHAKIRYSVLIDNEAEIIERLGLLNTNVPKESPANNRGRIPFAGHYLLSSDGRVLDSKFTDDLRHRPSGVDLVFRRYGPGSSSEAVEIKTGEIRAQVILSTARVLNNQDIAVLIRFEIVPGLHVYGAPLPAHYTSLSVLFDEELLARQQFEYPNPKYVTLEAIGETLPIYDGTFEVPGTIRLKWSPPAAQRGSDFDKHRIPPGSYTLRGMLNYQACGDSSCLMPVSAPFSLPLTILPDALPKTMPFPRDYILPNRVA
jgi:peroxiredoxin